MKTLIIIIGIILLLIGISLVLISIPSYIKKTENVVYVVTMPPPAMREQFVAGNIDGFLINEPVAADVVLNKNGSYLIQSSEIWPNHPCCLLTTNIKDEDIVKALVWAHVKATEFINDKSNEQKVINYAMDFTGSDENVIKEAMKHIKFVEYPNEAEIKNYYYKLNEAGFFIKSLADLGYESDEDFFSELFDRSYYDYVKQNPNWKPSFINKTVRLGYFTANLHHLASYVALKEGYYSVFQNVEFIPFPDGHKVMDAYKADLIDASYIGAPPLMLKKINENVSVTIIGSANEEGQALVVKKDIKSLRDLKGKTIAIVGLGTVPDFLLRMVAEKAGLEFQLKK